MPYYIYRMFSFPIRRLEKVEEAPTFGAASAQHAEALRRLATKRSRSLPYYVYRMFSFPIRRLEKVEEAPTFGAASARAKALRVGPDLPEGCAIKVIFAANELEAEDLLSQVRAPKPGLVGDE